MGSPHIIIRWAGWTASHGRSPDRKGQLRWGNLLAGLVTGAKAAPLDVSEVPGLTDLAPMVLIAEELEPRVSELGRQVVSRIRRGVAFYANTSLITDEALAISCAATLGSLVDGLKGSTIDTSPAVASGCRRAEAGVPLPAVMAAFRISFHQVWDAVAELARPRPNIVRNELLRAATWLWQAQGLYTDAMVTGHDQQMRRQVLDDDAERLRLTEALFLAHVGDHRTRWEVAKVLGLPQSGPYVVVAAECPAAGTQALPGAAAMLRSLDVYSAWLLLPDIHAGIAFVPNEARYAAVLGLLERVASTQVGVSPRFDDLADTAEALRYARVAVNSGGGRSGLVGVFEDSPLAALSVCAPEVTRKLANTILRHFDDHQTGNERHVLLDTFRVWVDCDGSISQTAEHLFCHPNTVRYRLRRIEEHTGRSLSAPRDLTELCLAFETYWNKW